MLLKNKIAVVYGAGGAIGGAVARAFAREGARLFLAGRHREPVAAAARDIADAGGDANVAEVDAVDERAIDTHLESVIADAGRIDIAFDAIGIPNTGIVGVPLVDLEVGQFLLPITGLATSYFLIARLAARRMIARRSGVIMGVTTQHSRMGLPLSGGYSPAMAAQEALTRALSAELAPHGIRVVGLRPQAVPESRTIRETFEIRSRLTGATWEQYHEALANKTHSRRLMTLAEIADTATFMASDRASGMTGTIVNLTMGSVDD